MDIVKQSKMGEGCDHSKISQFCFNCFIQFNYSFWKIVTENFKAIISLNFPFFFFFFESFFAFFRSECVQLA